MFKSGTGDRFMGAERTARALRRWAGSLSALALLLAVLSGDAAAGEAIGLRIDIPPVVEAREGGFYLGEYAAIDGDPILADSASMVWIEPRDGVFELDDVIAALGTSQAAERSVTISMPDAVRVLPESRVVSELRALTAWKWRIGIEGAEDLDIGEYSSYSLPPRVQPGARTVMLKLIDGGGKKINRQIKLKWFQPVIYSTKALQRGSVIDAADLRMRIDEIGMIGTCVWLPQQLANAEVRQSLGAGRAITVGDVEQTELVRAGTSVTLIAQVNGLGIEARGIAMQRGGIGDIIKVKNLSSKKILSGKIVDAGRVLINR